MPTLRPYQIDILNRVHDAWKHGYKAPCVVLPCGGGKSCVVAEMAKLTTWSGERVLFIVHRIELVDQIRRMFISWGVDMDYCTVGMVQMLTRRVKTMPPPKLIITDENHHCIAASYRRIYDAFPNAYKVGVTATPVRLNGDGLGDVNDTLIVGATAEWLIDNRYLASYEYYAPEITDITVGLHTRMGEYVQSEIESKLMKSAIYGDVISNYRKLADGKKAICYCASIKHSAAVAEAFNAAGIPAAHLDGDTPKLDRAGIITNFRSGKIRVICNMDLISEGFDVPDCDCAILLRPTKSLTLYIQQSMRCMRYMPDKHAIIIDHVGNYARFGMPDAPREWTLEKKDKKAHENNTVSVITCPSCYRTFERENILDGKFCPYCREPLPKMLREIEEKPNTELKKIEGFRLSFSRPEDCKTFGELQAYGKARGYKNGWAWHQAKQRGLLNDRA